jgi:hypothetical protein
LKEQKKYDQVPLGLLNLLQRIVLLADKVADEIICKETDNLEKAIPRMFEVMQRVAEFSCDYVKCGRFGRKSPFLGLTTPDDRREKWGWSGPPAEDRRNGERVDRGYQRL